MIYTIDNPKSVKDVFNFSGKKTFTGVVKDKHNNVAYYVNGKIHREDGPAFEDIDGTKEWCLNEIRHRTDGPAVEHANGDKEWYVNGQLHREDGPAIELTSGAKSWRLYDKQYGKNNDFTNESWIRFVKLQLVK